MKLSERWRLVSLAITFLALVCTVVGASIDEPWVIAAGSVLVLVAMLTGEIYRYWVWHQ
jgi:hypothetical protein